MGKKIQKTKITVKMFAESASLLETSTSENKTKIEAVLKY